MLSQSEDYRLSDQHVVMRFSREPTKALGSRVLQRLKLKTTSKLLAFRLVMRTRFLYLFMDF